MRVPALAIVCVVSYEASLFIIISCALGVETYPIRGHCSLSLCHVVSRVEGKENEGSPF